jgi:hypothetical protein
MARRLRSRSFRPGPARPGPAPARPAGPRSGVQLLVWVLTLGVFCGLALLSGQTLGSGSRSESSRPAASASSATSVSPAASVSPEAGERVLAAAGQVPSDHGASSGRDCKKWDEDREYLPLNRWTSFSLHTVDNAWILKTRLFTSMIASMMFMTAAMIWSLIGMLMGFGFTFDMICSAAPSINSGARTLSLYASWFLIPAWLFVLAAVLKRWSGDGKKGGGPGSALRPLMVFLAATGMIFFIGDQSEEHLEEHQGKPMGPYTVPWMAATVQGWFSVASDSLVEMSNLTDLGEDGNSVFYDDRAAGKVTCAKLDNALYKQYAAQNEKTGFGNGNGFGAVGAMTQVSKIWEITFVRSWVAAQFGEGNRDHPSPAHAACRKLEADSDVDTASKLNAYGLSIDKPKGTTPQNSYRGFHISPTGGSEKTLMVAWGACMGNDDGLGSGKTIPQWNPVAEGKENACKFLYSGASLPDGSSWLRMMWTGQAGGLGEFYFNGQDELNEQFGDCVATNAACRYDWAFVSGWLGANQAERLTQALMSLIVSFVFLFVLGPMALGMVISVALAGLVMMLPLSLLLFAMGLEQGKKLLKLTGTAAAGTFLFTMALTVLVVLIKMANDAIIASIGSDTPSFFEQVAQGAAPLACLWLFKRLSKVLGTGNISSMSGALGFAGAAVLRSTGDPRMSRDAARRMSDAIGRIGMGDRRLSALDERSLQRRMLNNSATRAMAGAVGRGAQRAARPVTDWTRDRYEAGRAGVLRARNALVRKASSGSPAQRAKAYAKLAMGAAAVTAAAPLLGPGAVLALPLVGLGGAAATVRGGQAAVNKIGAMFGRGDTGSGGASLATAGIPMAKSARTGLREADDWHRNIIRVSNPNDRRGLTAEHTGQGLDMYRARLWGAGHSGGLNLGFRGFADDEEMAEALSKLSAVTGLKPDQLMLSKDGLALPVSARNRRTGQLKFAPNTTIEQASNPVHFMDPATLRRQKNNGVEESDDQYIGRLTAQLRERGYVTDSGEFVDVFAANGFDTRVPEVRERVAAFISGVKDEELSQIKINARRSEDGAVQASRSWTQDQWPAVLDRISNDPEMVRLVVMDHARNDIDGRYADIRVDMPDGRNGTVGDVHVEIDKQFNAMKSIVLKAQMLHERRDEFDTSDFEQQSAELAALQGARAMDIDRLSEVLRDAADASSAAHNNWKINLINQLAPSSMDITEVEREIEKANEATQERKRAWHRELERLAGGLARVPSDAAQAGVLDDLLEDLKVTLGQRAADEGRANWQLMGDLRDVEQQLEDHARLAMSDPRRAEGPVDMRRLLNTMFNRGLTRR